MRQSQLWNKCAVRADSVHVRHAIVEVNVVIGVVLGELHVVVRVHVPLVVCDDAVIGLTLGLITHVVVVVFVVAMLKKKILYWKYTLYRIRKDVDLRALKIDDSFITN